MCFQTSHEETNFCLFMCTDNQLKSVGEQLLCDSFVHKASWPSTDLLDDICVVLKMPRD